jgi:hypothetical protein
MVLLCGSWAWGAPRADDDDDADIVVTVANSAAAPADVQTPESQSDQTIAGDSSLPPLTLRVERGGTDVPPGDEASTHPRRVTLCRSIAESISRCGGDACLVRAIPGRAAPLDARR